MKSLYFMFAVLALPVMAFAEAGDSMTTQTTVKDSAAKDAAAPQSYTCKEGNKTKCVQNGRKRSLKMKHNDLDRNEHAEHADGKEG